MTAETVTAEGLPLVLVACSAAKAGHRAPARQLYTGSLFALAMRAAEALTRPELIRILSAKHGLVSPDEMLDPYNTQWGDADSADISLLWTQTLRLPDFPYVVSLMPSAYTSVAAVAFDGPLMWPLRHAGGIGWMRHRLALIAGDGAVPAVYQRWVRS